MADPGDDVGPHKPVPGAERGGLTVGAHRLQPFVSQVAYGAPSLMTQPAGVDVHLGLSKSSTR